jgi:transcriptional regulator with XRE-family HTH domain
MGKKDLGQLLKKARIKKKLSQSEVADRLGLQSAQSVSDWERNYGSGVPIASLKILIKLYGLDKFEVFDALMDYQINKLKENLEKEFFSASNK